MKPVSIAQAASMTGKSKSTITRAIKKGELSTTKHGKAYRIDPAELARVFAITSHDARHDASHDAPRRTTEPPDAPSTDALEMENRLLREMLDRERETVDDLRQRLTRAQALIEDRRTPAPRPWRWPWSR